MKFLITLIILIGFCFAGEELTTNSFKDIEAKALTYGQKHGNHNVLVAIDIDNTLLAMPQNYGSDQWFNWQYENCVGKKKIEDYCISDNMGDFLDIQGQIFAVSNMVPSDEHVVSVVKNLQDKGFKVILLTSRGSEFRSATERAIKQHNMSFTSKAIKPEEGYPSTYFPYDLKKLKQYGITKEEAAVAKLGTPRKVSYQNGIFMGSGQHKGIMLKTLLHKTNKKFRAIVFADDHEKHTKRMQAIFGSKKEIDITTFRYGKMDSQVQDFEKSDKKEVIKAHEAFMEMKKKVFK